MRPGVVPGAFAFAGLQEFDCAAVDIRAEKINQMVVSVRAAHFEDIIGNGVTGLEYVAGDADFENDCRYGIVNTGWE